MIKAKKVILAGMILLSAGAIVSCKGRTMSNMEPKGETVEVQVAPLPDASSADTAGVIPSSETEL